MTPAAAHGRSAIQWRADCPSAENHRLTIYPGGDHNSWARTYDLSAGNDVYTWLLGFTRP